MCIWSLNMKIEITKNNVHTYNTWGKYAISVNDEQISEHTDIDKLTKQIEILIKAWYMK